MTSHSCWGQVLKSYAPQLLLCDKSRLNLKKSDEISLSDYTRHQLMSNVVIINFSRATLPCDTELVALEV